MIHHLVCAVLVGVLCTPRAVSSLPLPYPLPVNFSFGVCGVDPSLVPNCSARISLATNLSVRCSAAPGCTRGCETSQLFQQVLTRYTARLASGATATTTTATNTNSNLGGALATPAHGVVGAGATRPYWWQLNNINCNLHDTGVTARCPPNNVTRCKEICEADPTCGAFLFYSKTGNIATK
jgi:hypothetical protein